jgi:hypothetical protein
MYCYSLKPPFIRSLLLSRGSGIELHLEPFAFERETNRDRATASEIVSINFLLQHRIEKCDDSTGTIISDANRCMRIIVYLTVAKAKSNRDK